MNPAVLEWAASLTAKQARWLAAVARHERTTDQAARQAPRQPAAQPVPPPPGWRPRPTWPHPETAVDLIDHTDTTATDGPTTPEPTP